MQLAKNQKMNLSKGGVTPVFKLGASWGRIPGKKKFGIFGGGAGEAVDLDLCSFGIVGTKIVDECSFRTRPNYTPYMKSSGDDRGGGGAQTVDNEIITLDTSKIPANVDNIVMIINSFTGHMFDDIPFAKIRVYEGQDNNPTKVLCEYNVANDHTFSGARTLIIGRIFRNGGNGWDFEAIGEARSYKSIDDFKREVGGMQ
jgi:tellurium resistance protein TerZ